jgi:hypothetical protein
MQTRRNYSSCQCDGAFDTSSDSIQSSAISPKEETINTILYTLSYVDNVLRNDIHDNRLDVIDRMDLLLDKSKHEENDYVTQKNQHSLH